MIQAVFDSGGSGVEPAQGDWARGAYGDLSRDGSSDLSALDQEF